MRYIVSYAEYNRNESSDALTCGVFRETYATAEAAHEAITECIRDEAENAMSDGECEGETVEDVVRGWTWRDEPRHVAAEHDGIESVYEVCALQDFG